MGKILLIVEDDPYVQRFYERLFRFHNYIVELAKDGEEGLVKARTLKPSLILLDIVMPGLNGIQVLEKLKNDEETKDISVVMLTNIDEADQMKKAVDLGAIDFIVKSAAPEEQLLSIVDKHLKP
jgi:CheY-like chemotaxis protein